MRLRGELLERLSGSKEGGVLAIEEPIYSWGRKNPKAFATSTAFMAGLILSTKPYANKTIVVNPKTMKLQFTGTGKADKDMIIAKAKQRMAEWNSDGDDSKFQWAKNKKLREAFADAMGIGFTAFRYLKLGALPGCYNL